MPSTMFRPVFFTGKYKLKNNPVGHYNWVTRKHYSSHMIRVGGQLHYLADHAPLAVQEKWKKSFKHFCKLYRKF